MLPMLPCSGLKRQYGYALGGYIRDISRWGIEEEVEAALVFSIAPNETDGPCLPSSHRHFQKRNRDSVVKKRTREKTNHFFCNYSVVQVSISIKRIASRSTGGPLGL